MKKILIIFVAVVLVAGLSGCTTIFGEPEPPTNGVEISLSNIKDIALSLNITEIDRLVNTSDELNVKVFGINGVTARDILTEYAQEHSGWTLQYSQDEQGVGWHSYIRAWSQVTYVHVVVIWGGFLVEQFSGYDVVVLTSHEQYTTYQNYFEW